MSKFKVGDLVKVVGCKSYGHIDNTGKVTQVNKYGDIHVDLATNDICTRPYTDYELLEKTLDNLVEGDVVVNADGDERTVLGVCGKVYLMSKWEGQEKYDHGFTAIELKEYGFKVKTDQPEKEEKINIEGELYSVSEIKEALKKAGKE